MSAWKRLGWGIVALGSTLACQVQASPISQSDGFFSRNGWAVGRSASLVNQTTAVTSWTPPAASSVVSAPATPVVVHPHIYAPAASAQTASVAPVTPSAPVYVAPVSVPAAVATPVTVTTPTPTPTPASVPASAPAPVAVATPVPAFTTATTPVQPYSTVSNPIILAPVPTDLHALFPSTPQPVYILPANFQLASSTTGSSDAQTSPTTVTPPGPPGSGLTLGAPTLAGATSTNTTPPVNAYINLGSGPFPDSGTIAHATPSPWFSSTNSQVSALFGGAPTAQQQADFSAAVFSRVQQTFQLSGLNLTLTNDPTVAAAHTISLVSNTYAQALPNAIGMTNIGGNGLSFIDQQAPAAQNLDQLEWIAAHNISHELMLALGVPEKFDGTGTYIDARNALWSMLTDPNATFSPAAIAALNQALTQSATNSNILGAQVLEPKAVPEPASFAVWTLAATLTLAYRLRSYRRAA